MATIADMMVRIGADTSALNKSLQTATKKLDAFGKSATRIGKSMSIAVTAPIMAAGTAVVYMAANFEQSMNKVAALTQATGADFDALSNQAKALGASTQYSASQAADAMGFLAMAGFETNQILGAMPSTLQLAAAAQMDLATAADITSNVLTGYQMQVSDLARVNDVLVKAFTSSNTDLQQLGEAMKYAGPVASGMGMAFEEAAAAIGMMGNAGIQASMAGTSLRGALVNLANPTREASAIMKQLGVNVFDSSGQMVPFVDVIRQLETSGAETAEIMQMFGLRAGPAMAALVSQGADALAAFTVKLQDSGGIAGSIADQQMAGFNGAMKRMKSAIESVAIAIGESGILDQLTGMVKRVADVIARVQTMNPELLRIATYTALAVAAIGPLLVVLGLMATSIAAIMSPITLIVAGLAALGLAAVLMYRNFHRTAENLTAAWQWVADDIKVTAGYIVSAWEWIYDDFLVTAGYLVRAWEWTKEHILTPVADITKGVWDWLVVNLGKVADEVWKVIEWIARPFVWLYNQIAELFGGASVVNEAISGATRSVVNAMTSQVNAAARVIESIARTTSGFFVDLAADGKDAGKDIKTAFKGVKDLLQGWQAPQKPLTPPKVPPIPPPPPGAGEDNIPPGWSRESIEGFGDYFQSTFQQIASSYDDLAAASVRWAQQTMIQMAGVIAKAVVLQGIMSMLGLNEGKAAVSVGTSIMGGFKKIFGLADGGIVTRPTLAMVGEGGGPEAVIPLDKLSAIGGGGEIVIHNHMNVDGREVATATGRYLPGVMARRGR